jgi:hypothetical protein
MGFRINRGIFQFSDGTKFINKFKIADDGNMVEVDPETGDPVTAYMKIGDKATDSDLLDGINSGAFLRADTSDNVYGNTEWQDNKQIRLGNGADFRMWHDGSHTYFRNYHHSAGNIYFQGEDTEGTNHALLYMFNNVSRPYISLYENGGEKFKTTSGGVEVLGDAYINQGKIHIKRGTGLTHTEWEDDSSANGRAQLILDSHYSDLIIASRNANSNKHGSTLTLATQSTSTNDVAKWVIGQGQYQEGAHIMAFAYGTNQTNPHSILGTDNANAEMLITNGAGVWSRNGFSGDLSGNASTATKATNLGSSYTADTWFRATGDNNTVKFYGNSRMMVFRTDGEGGDTGHTGYAFKWTYGGDGTGATRMLLDNNGNLWTSSYGWLHSRFETAGAASTAESNAVTHADTRIDDEVLPLINDIGDAVTTNRGEITALGSAKLDKTAKAADSNLLDGIDSGRFFRRLTAANGTAGAGWITVATCTSGRHSGEVYVTDGESGDHAFIRIHWMRSYQDSNFSVLNCGGHANRITGVRVLYQTSDNTYGVKLLQVYVTTSSNYYVRIHQEGDTPNFGTPSAVTPVVENTKSGYALHGNELTGLEHTSMATEEGIRVGGTAFINSISSTGGDIQNVKGSYLHIGGWAVSRTHASAVLVNTAYRADILNSSRTLTIGDTGKSFNGSANVSWTLAEIGAETAGAAAAVEENLTPQIEAVRTTADDAATVAADAQSTADTAIARANGAREDTVAIGVAVEEAQAAADAAQTTADSKLDATAKAADSNLLDGINSTQFLRSDADDSTSGGLTIGGSLSRGTYTTVSQYHTGADNLVLKGNNVGISGIFFESEKNGTNINHPSDFGFIQYHAYGTSTSGESNELIIGVSNDADDHVILNAPNVNGLRFRVGAIDTDYTVWHSGNFDPATKEAAGSADAVSSRIDDEIIPLIAEAQNAAENAQTTADGKAALAGSLGQDFSVDDLYYDKWLRNHSNTNGLYWSTTGWHLYPKDNDDFLFRSGNNSSAALRFYTGDTERNYLYCNNSNEVGFLNTSRAWIFRVYNNGNVVASGDITAYSDARLKENVKPIENALEKVTKLQGVTYTRNDSEDKSTKIGFIAQEVKEVVPELVAVSPDELSGLEDRHSLDYGKMVALLTEAVKEQQKQIEELKARLDGVTD